MFYSWLLILFHSRLFKESVPSLILLIILKMFVMPLLALLSLFLSLFVELAPLFHGVSFLEMFGSLWICAPLCNVISRFVLYECFFFLQEFATSDYGQRGGNYHKKCDACLLSLSSEHRILPFSSGYILLFCSRDPWSKLLQSGWIEEPLLGILIGILNPSLSPLTSGPLLSLENVLPLGLKQPKTPFQYHSPPSKLSFWPALLFIHPVLSVSISQEFLNILNPAVSPLLIFLCTYEFYLFFKNVYLVQSVSCSVMSASLRSQGL